MFGMDKDILSHKKFIQSEILRISEIRDENLRKTSAEVLLKIHDVQTKNFQHERLVHLIITLFFAVLTFASWVTFAIWFVVSADSSGDKIADLTTFILFLLSVILTILEVFYVRHYYNLENRIQKLYGLSEEVYNLVAGKNR
jgi:hypothetical protein